ncbi:MAG: hypothetical protein K1X63_10675 [Chitinophagales bacterium]|nr:hypothetical protein [Chitinophagales bacterium]
METVANDLRVANALHWIARILCITAILFIGMFSLDVFEPGLPLRQQLLGFFMHNIPALILVGLLIVAWKRELIGGALIALIALLLAPYIYSHNYSMNHSVSMSLSIVAIINLPFIIVGVLFILSHYITHKRHST